MGHPPAVTSDLSLKDFLRNVTAFNLDNKDQRKGIKLDFKTIGVFEQAMDSLKANFATVSHGHFSFLPQPLGGKMV